MYTYWSTKGGFVRIPLNPPVYGPELIEVSDI